MRIYFTGFMGSGKSSVGKFLSKQTDLNHLDLDNYIEKTCGMDIDSLFNSKGEVFFRHLELECLNKIIQQEDNIIISLGGGSIQSVQVLKKIKTNWMLNIS